MQLQFTDSPLCDIWLTVLHFCDYRRSSARLAKTASGSEAGGVADSVEEEDQEPDRKKLKVKMAWKKEKKITETNTECTGTDVGHDFAAVFWERAYCSLLSKAMLYVYDMDKTGEMFRYKNLQKLGVEDMSAKNQEKLKDIFAVKCKFRKDMLEELDAEVNQLLKEEETWGARVVFGNPEYWESSSKGLENRRRAETEKIRLRELEEKWEDLDDESRKFAEFRDDMMDMLPQGVADRAREVKALKQAFEEQEAEQAAKDRAQQEIADRAREIEEQEIQEQPEELGDAEGHVAEEPRHVEPIGPGGDADIVCAEDKGAQCAAKTATEVEHAPSVSSVSSLDLQKTIEDLKKEQQRQVQEVQDRLTRQLKDEMSGFMSQLKLFLPAPPAPTPLLKPKAEQPDDDVIEIVDEDQGKPRGGAGDVANQSKTGDAKQVAEKAGDPGDKQADTDSSKPGQAPSDKQGAGEVANQSKTGAAKHAEKAGDPGDRDEKSKDDPGSQQQKGGATKEPPIGGAAQDAPSLVVPQHCDTSPEVVAETSQATPPSGSLVAEAESGQHQGSSKSSRQASLSTTGRSGASVRKRFTGVCGEPSAYPKSGSRTGDVAEKPKKDTSPSEVSRLIFGKRRRGVWCMTVRSSSCFIDCQ